jgi:hypothetical protein
LKSAASCTQQSFGYWFDGLIAGGVDLAVVVPVRTEGNSKFASHQDAVAVDVGGGCDLV